MTKRQQAIHTRVMGLQAGLALEALHALRGQRLGFSVTIRLPPQFAGSRPHWRTLFEGPSVRIWREARGLVYVDGDDGFYTRKGRTKPKARILLSQEIPT